MLQGDPPCLEMALVVCQMVVFKITCSLGNQSSGGDHQHIETFAFFTIVAGNKVDAAAFSCTVFHRVLQFIIYIERVNGMTVVVAESCREQGL